MLNLNATKFEAYHFVQSGKKVGSKYWMYADNSEIHIYDRKVIHFFYAMESVKGQFKKKTGKI